MNIFARFHENWSNTDGVRNASFVPFLPIMCCYHSNILSSTVIKMSLAHLHSKAHITFFTILIVIYFRTCTFENQYSHQSQYKKACIRQYSVSFSFTSSIEAKSCHHLYQYGGVPHSFHSAFPSLFVAGWGGRFLRKAISAAEFRVAVVLEGIVPIG